MNTLYKSIALIIGVSLMLVSLAGIAVAPSTATVELIDGKFIENASESYTAWAYADANFAPAPAEFSLTLNDPNPWVSGSGHLALLDGGDNMVIASTVPTTCMYVQFVGDGNDGWATVYVDGVEVWSGNTYNVGHKYLKITDMAPTTHTVTVECMGITGAYDDHVCMLHFGLDEYNNNQEIPEFPTIALPIAAILGLAFFFQRRKE
ncbi:MAG: PEF-CTERM sorting domain-containing protein [Euryarchaeota archaeon]|nr:PEF-CTERM sorting domain-containing protein [Euryarchaeota archaeon]